MCTIKPYLVCSVLCCPLGVRHIRALELESLAVSGNVYANNLGLRIEDRLAVRYIVDLLSQTPVTSYAHRL
eukprot:SAG31_NODE_1517_length_8031_cov_18.008699_4_plen_71_part_00